MNNKTKISLGIVLVLILVIGIFFITNREENSKGTHVSLVEGDYHYVSSDLLEVPKGGYIFETMMFDEDNNLIYMIRSKDGCYVYKGFGEEREVLSPDVKPTREDLAVKGFTMDTEGNIYVLYGVWRGKETMNIYNKSKELIEADIDMEGDLTEIANMCYFDERLYILDYDCNLQVYTLDGKLIKDDIYSQQIYSIDIDDKGNLYAIKSREQNKLKQNMVKIDCTTNKMIFDIPLEIPFQNIIVYNETNERTYTTDGNSIYEFDSEGNLIGEEVELASDVSLVFGSTNKRGIRGLDALLFDAKGNFYIFANGNQSLASNIYMLTKTQGIKPPDTRKEIVLTAAYENDFIIDVINLYNLQNEEYKVVLDAQYKTYDEFMQNPIEAGEKLAARIMANDVGDIIATGGNALNYYDLFKTDAFMDLNDFIKSDKNYDNLNKSVLDGLIIDGKIRGLPLGIAYYSIVYNKDLGDELGLNLDLQNVKWSEILELSMKLNDENSNISVFNTQERDLSTYFVLLLQANMPDLINIENKKVDLKQDWFLELLSNFKTASNLNTFKTYRPYDRYNLTGDDSLFYFKNISARHREDFDSISNNKYEILQFPAFVGEQNRNAIAFPIVMLSIGGNSANKETAWDFFSFLLEEQIQILESLNGHPVNLQAEKSIREYYNMEHEFSKQVDHIINRVDYLYDMSYYKEDIVLPIEKYFNDEISLEEAIDEAEHNIWLRLNE